VLQWIILFQIQVVLLWNAHPFALRTSQVFLENVSTYLNYVMYMSFFFFRSSPGRNFIKCQKLDFTTINHGILRLLRHHMGTEKLLSFVMYSLLGYLCLLHCAIVLRCTPYLDCLVPFVWWQVHADETKSSLQFASRALRVTNCARVNEVLR
jgi:hypothetical protein